MPIEVRELIIKGTVVSGKPKGNGNYSENDKETIVQDCVDRVMQILKEKKER